MSSLNLLLIGTSFLFGIRHGIDWDHIAAISDITGASKNAKEGITHGTMYAIGHSTVIIVLGVFAVFLGVKLPSWIDGIMQPLVGVTLILLGIWLIFSIIINGGSFRLMSRWMLIFKFFTKIYNHLHSKIKHSHSPLSYPEKFGKKTAYIVGVIHGIGAETPTQLLLFLTAAGVSGKFFGSILLLIFVFGLFISNSLITVISMAGFARVSDEKKIYKKIYIGLGLISAVFSIVVGFLFLSSSTGILPAINE